MKQRNIAAIFPAFGGKYLGNEQDLLHEYSDLLPDLLYRAEKTVKLNVREFLSRTDGNFKDELQSQYAAYLFSSALSEVIKRSGLHTKFAAGYSMGLYAALYHAESITFEQGLDLIYTAYQNIMSSDKTSRFGVGVISGLELTDVSNILAAYDDLEIINVNNKVSFLIAGYEENVRTALAIARGQGALHIKYLSLNSPYHSRFMEGAAREFTHYLDSVKIQDPVYPIISTVDQREINSSSEVVRDLADNVCRNINWLNTMTRMIEAGVDTFIECGPGKSLYEISKFIDGMFEVYTAHTLKNLIVADMIPGQLPAVSGRL